MTASENQERNDRYRTFLVLLAEHEHRLVPYVHSLIPLWQDAEDVLQNTRLRLWEQFETFDPDSDFAAWAITVATYMVRTYRTLSQRQRVCFSDRLLEKITQNIPSTNPSIRDDRLSVLVTCVQSLDCASRRLLQLVFVEHRRIKDAANDLGHSPSTVRKSLFRIRRVLFGCVQRGQQSEKR